jgi:hypothetical protein
MKQSWTVVVKRLSDQTVQVFERFYSSRRDLPLNLARAVGDDAWIRQEQQRLAGCRTQRGQLAYHVTYGHACPGYCIESPAHRAAGMSGWITHHKVFV